MREKDRIQSRRYMHILRPPRIRPREHHSLTHAPAAIIWGLWPTTPPPATPADGATAFRRTLDDTATSAGCLRLPKKRYPIELSSGEEKCDAVAAPLLVRNNVLFCGRRRLSKAYWFSRGECSHDHSAKYTYPIRLEKTRRMR